MAAKDNLSKQFGASNPQQIPAHHQNAILKAINSMGERGMELMPGGIHVTPSDGGKPHIIPHHTVSLKIRGWEEGQPATIVSNVPSEGADVHLWADKDELTTGLDHAPLFFKSAYRGEHDDPAHFMDRTHDTRVPGTAGDSGINTDIGHVYSAPNRDAPPAARYKDLASFFKYEDTHPRLPHLGGDPKKPAISLENRTGPQGFVSEQLDAIKGLHRAWSHVYNEHDYVYGRDRGDKQSSGPTRSSDRNKIHVIFEDNLKDKTTYMYNISNGQITKGSLDD